MPFPLSIDRCNPDELQSFSAQVVVQVLVAGIADRLVADTAAIQSGDGLHGLLPGKVIVKVTVDLSVTLQMRQRLSEVADRVHHQVVAGYVDTDGAVLHLPECQIGQKVHESLKQADAALHFTVQVRYQGYVLAVDAPLVVGVAHLVAAGDVSEASAK